MVTIGRRAMLGLLVLGIVGMHGLVLLGGAAAVHQSGAGSGAVHASTQAGDHGGVAVDTDAPPRAETGEGSEGTALALCLGLLLAFAFAHLPSRRTPGISFARARRLRPPGASRQRDRTAVPRFTVMRC